MIISLDMFQTAGMAVLVFLLGKLISKNVPIISKFCIPDPVVGGVIFSLFAFIGYETGIVVIEMDTSLESFFMTCFFTTVGFTASFQHLKKGGVWVGLLVMCVVLLIVLQNIVGVWMAKALSLDPLFGLCTGSIPLTGGLGTSAAFAAMFEKDYGLDGALTIALASATFGLVMGSLIGGPVAKQLIEKNNLKPVANRVWKESNTSGLKTLFDSKYIVYAFFAILAATGFGSVISLMLNETGLTFPDYVGAMFAAAIFRNIADLNTETNVRMEEIEALGDVFLTLFLAMALMSLKLWELKALAGPLATMLLAQTVLAIFFTTFVTFNLMGRDYDAAIMSAGHCGFGMGSTPNAVANMNSLCGKYGHSRKSFVIVPIVGSLFNDFCNSTIITLFVNVFHH